MVAASKMKKAQSAALQGRPYADKIAQMTSEFASRIDPGKHPLLKINAGGKSLVVLISTNKGLLGGLNTNLFRQINRWYTKEELSDLIFVTVGKKGEQFLVKSARMLAADFSQNLPFSTGIPALTTYITDGYIKGEFNSVTLIYNNFITALTQEPVKKIILPLTEFTQVSRSETNQIADKTHPAKLEFIIEPAIDQILDELLVSYLENQVRDSILEAEASEHSARMIAMKNATENAKELIEILTLEYNKARQEKITSEIADMVTARLAVE